MSCPESYLYVRVKLYAWVTLGILGGIFANLAIKYFFDWSTSDSESQILLSYLQVVGGIYGVVIGFVIFVVWNQFTESSIAIDQEVSNLRALSRLSLSTRDQAYATHVQQSIKTYVQSVIALQNEEGSFDAREAVSTAAWEELQDFIYRSPGEHPRDRAILSQMLRKIDELSVTRSSRLGRMHARIPWPLWHLLIFVSVIVVLPSCFLTVPNASLDAAIVGLTSGAIVFFLIVVYDLDNPSRGVFNVSFAPYQRFLDKF